MTTAIENPMRAALLLSLLPACTGKLDDTGASGAWGLAIAIDPAAPVRGDTLTAQVVTDAVDPDGGTISYTYAWTLNNSEWSGGDVESVPGDTVVKGDQWAVTVTPYGLTTTDTGGVPLPGDPAVAAVVIGDTPPSLDGVELGPEQAYESTTLTVTLATASDVDGDAIVYTYDWYVGDAVVQSGTVDTLTGAMFGKGDIVYVAVTPSADGLPGVPVPSNALVIGNSAPSFDGVTVEPQELHKGDVATCTPTGFADPDGDAPQWVWSWSVNGEEVAATETLDGAYYSRDDDVSCTATPFDGEAEGTPLTADEVTVLNSAPVVDSATLSNDSPTASETITIVKTAHDDDGDGMIYQYEWFVNGADVGRHSSLDPSYFTVGDSVYATVTAWDARDYSEAVATETAVVVP